MSECLFVCVDNSEWMRNGDYYPSRWESQVDAVLWLIRQTLLANQESAVGLISMAGEHPEVVVSPTSELTPLLSGLHTIRLGGTLDLDYSVKLSSLALKNSGPQGRRRRMIMFIGGALRAEQKEVDKLMSPIRRGGLIVDFVSMSGDESTEALLKSFIERVPGNSPSTDFHFIPISPTSEISVRDHLRKAYSEASSNGGGEGGRGGGRTLDGVSEENDPELFAALQASMQDLAAMNAAATVTQASVAPVTPAAAPEESNEMDEYDEEMRLAIQMSIAEANQRDEEARTAQNTTAPTVTTATATPSTVSDSIPTVDPAAVQATLRMLPGVDLNDPELQKTLKSMTDSKHTKPNPEDKK